MPLLTELDLDRNNAHRMTVQAHPPSYGFPTARRYPRSTREAFPCERAVWIERHVRPASPLRDCAWWAGVLCVAAFVLHIAA